MERDSNKKFITIPLDEYERLSSERTKAFLALNLSLDRNLEEYCQRKVKECEELKLEIEKLKKHVHQ